jgi:uncharacterized protein (UPF0548 family)
VRWSRPGPAELAAALDALRARPLNYDPAAAPGGGRPAGHWHVDAGEVVLGQEPPGAPAPDGPWAAARQLIGQYEITDGRLVRAIYRPSGPLAGRDMLLQGRFAILRFYLGVRITEVTDQTRDAAAGTERAWGWSYQTLLGHLEQGRLSYEVIKNLRTGQVTFRMAGYSRAAPIRSPVIALGFALFGRPAQRRFYRDVQRRVAALVRASQAGAALPRPALGPAGVAIAPAVTARHPGGLALTFFHPGR